MTRRLRPKDATCFKIALRRLQDRCPTAKPVRIEWRPKWRCKRDGFMAATMVHQKDVIRIAICSAVSAEHAIDLLIHEWAHAMTWVDRQYYQLPLPYHGEEWGKAYAKAYQATLTKGEEAVPDDYEQCIAEAA